MAAVGQLQVDDFGEFRELDIIQDDQGAVDTRHGSVGEPGLRDVVSESWSIGGMKTSSLLSKQFSAHAETPRPDSIKMCLASIYSGLELNIQVKMVP